MSMVQQLVNAVSAAERQIDSQIGQLSAYSNELERVTMKINNALEGSTQDYGRQMLQQLSVTKMEVRESMEKLQAAKRMLAYVRTI